MRYHRIHAVELSSEHLAAWADLLGERDELMSPFFRPEFTQAIARVRSDVEVVVIEDGAWPVGFFPYQVNRLRWGKPVGYPLTDYQGPILRAGMRVAWDALFRAARLRCFDFDHLATAKEELAVFCRRREPSWWIDLSNGLPAYEAALAAQHDQVRQLRHHRRKIERDVGPLTFTTRSTDASALAALLRWKRDQYHRTGIADAFGVAWTRALMEHLLHEKRPSFSGVLTTLHAGDRLAAAHMGMWSQRVWHHWFPAYDRELKKFSPGLQLLWGMIQAAPALGVCRVDLGKGDDAYKQRFVNASAEVAEGSVERSVVVRGVREIGRAAWRLGSALPVAGLRRAGGAALRRWAGRRRLGS
jgi:CelD/BcsL family acetyltransferase involved in cellulose biosynthesis